MSGVVMTVIRPSGRGAGLERNGHARHLPVSPPGARLTGMDWRPGYREQAPPAPLRPSVTCFWARVGGAGPGEAAQVLPDACVDLIWRRGHGVFVAGPDTGPVPSPMPP